MPDLDLESLLTPLPGDAPCGADLEYDPAFLALEEAGSGRAEQQYGDTVIAAREADWPVVHEQALQLAGRTRDLRVAVWLVRGGARVSGLSGAVQGLQLLRGLLERYWDQVHPQLDASDNNDPTARLSALTPLVHGDAVLADLRAAGLSAARGSLRVRDIELSLGKAEALPGEAVPTEDGVMQAVAAALAQSAGLGATMQAGLDAARGIAAAVEQRLGAGQGPDFAPLKKLLQPIAEAARRAGAAPDGSTGEPAHVSLAAAAVTGAAGAIASREDAVRALQRVCEWIERNEPSNPAPLLIHRAQRLMSKNFIDIIRDLVPDGLSQVEKLAGIGGEQG